MVCAGRGHTVLLRSDGLAVQTGGGAEQRVLYVGRLITQVAAANGGDEYWDGYARRLRTFCLTAALTEDGQVEVYNGTRLLTGDHHLSGAYVPPQHSYVALAVGRSHAVALTANGLPVAWGSGWVGRLAIPILNDGRKYTQAAAGLAHTALLLNDGTALALGDNSRRQCDIPELPGGLYYTQVAAGDFHTVLIVSDGTARAVGWNLHGQCDCPNPPNRAATPDVGFVQAAAGAGHTVLLTNRGEAVAFGLNFWHQCDIPPPPPGATWTYAQAAAGTYHTVLITTDGQAIACGRNDFRQCDIPELPNGLVYVPQPVSKKIVQASSDGLTLRLTTLAGAPVRELPIRHTETLTSLRSRLDELLPGLGLVTDVILPSGAILTRQARQTPRASAGRHMWPTPPA